MEKKTVHENISDPPPPLRSGYKLSSIHQFSLSQKGQSTQLTVLSVAMRSSDKVAKAANHTPMWIIFQCLSVPTKPVGARVLYLIRNKCYGLYRNICYVF